MERVRLRIAELRHRNNITQQQLAEIAGVSFQTISKWENGESHSDNNENSEAVFMGMKEALLRDDVTHMTKVALRAMLDKGDGLLIPDLEYKKTKGEDYELYI